MSGSVKVSLEALIDRFATEGGVSLAESKEVRRDENSGRTYTLWSFPILGGALFTAVIYQHPEDNALADYLDIQVALGTLPMENCEHFLEAILVENSSIPSPIKIAMLAPDIFGLRMRARMDLICPEYWPRLLVTSITYGASLFERLQKQYAIESFENASQRANH